MSPRPIFYDTETTGIRPDRDRIVEIAAHDPVLNRSFVKLINPGCLIPQEASAIHGITDHMVASSPNFGQIKEEFIQFCDGDVILIAHNNDSFDLPFLQNEFKRHQAAMPSWKFLDSLKWARRYRPDLPRHSLQFLREAYGIPENRAHRALDDVIVLHKIFSIMIDDLPLDKVCELLTKPRSLSHMPFGKHQGKALSTLPKDYVKWLSSSGALDKPDNQELKGQFMQLGLLA